MKLLRRWKQTAIHNKALVLTSVIVAFGTLFYAFAAIFQIYLMDSAAKSSANQTERLIVEMSRQSQAMKDVAAANKKAVELAERSIKATQKQFSMEQRAWIGIPEVVVDSPEETSDSVSYKGISLIFRNSGKTPAINWYISYVVISSLGSEPPFDFDKAAKDLGRRPNEFYIWQPKKAQGVFTPGGEYSIKVSPPAVHRGEGSPRMVYILGKITYNDIFPGTAERTTKYCFAYTPSYRNVPSASSYSFTPCPEGNWMN